MTNHKYDFDFSKLKEVSVDKVVANGWNPKDKETKEFRQIVKSIEVNGLRQPVVVREVDGHYEIIDGEQRFTAAVENGYKKVYVYNEGQMDEKQAKALTIWYQVQVPFDEVDLSHLVVELADMNMELPYSESQIADFRGMAEFNFENYDENGVNDEPDDNAMVVFTVKMTKDQRDSLNQAMTHVKDMTGDNISDGRALELIAADYLSGAAPIEQGEA